MMEDKQKVNEGVGKIINSNKLSLLAKMGIKFRFSCRIVVWHSFIVM